MPTESSAQSLTDILFEEPRNFVGLYDVEQGWYSRVNAAGCRLLGYASVQDLYADPSRTLFQQKLLPDEWSRIQERVLHDGFYEFEAEIQRQSGTTFWAHIDLTRCLLDGRLYVLVRFADTDRLHDAERSLAQSVGRFEAVVAHATIGIIMCNAQGEIVLANDLAQQLFGYPPATLLGQRIEALVPDAVRARHTHLRESFNAHPQVRAMGANRDLQARRRDGTVFPVEISLSYFHLDAELYVVAYIIDITLKREAERELRAQHQRVERLNTELEQKVSERTHALMTTLAQLEKRSQELTQALAAEQELGELKSRFVSMASHEFRTPLTGILTSASLIEKYPATQQQDKRQRHLERIRGSVKHLTDILEEFLSVGRIEEGKIEAHPADLELAALLEETILDVQGLLKAGQRIERRVQGPGRVRLDPSLLRKILVNLLSNALKYSGEHSVVLVQAEGGPSQLTLRVQDQGMGISREDQEHLFERFFRARNAANLPGTGLGLYIVARYVELMRGTIALRSELNVGTTVTITIPYENYPAD
ncbi:sensor histidine kinase [Hymenobacter persicinus]|uniref:histidine kinase n=1 Tax=Hymenobacter persicinus TaxID=2025506 RepID=A0A4Q5LEZ9_9BACT|nr:ATP-binding protein [Hymenobacter persicinus]RYU81543.1 PAS domain-containing sensor histidine kinase [Hymenobacter persicinus]